MSILSMDNPDDMRDILVFVVDLAASDHASGRRRRNGREIAEFIGAGLNPRSEQRRLLVLVYAQVRDGMIVEQARVGHETAREKAKANARPFPKS